MNWQEECIMDAIIDRADHLRKEAKEQDLLDQIVQDENLRLIQTRGFLRSKIATENLIAQGLIYFCSACDGIPYDHYKLTEQGKSRL